MCGPGTPSAGGGSAHVRAGDPPHKGGVRSCAGWGPPSAGGVRSCAGWGPPQHGSPLMYGLGTPSAGGLPLGTFGGLFWGTCGRSASRFLRFQPWHPPGDPPGVGVQSRALLGPSSTLTGGAPGIFWTRGGPWCEAPTDFLCTFSLGTPLVHFGRSWRLPYSFLAKRQNIFQHFQGHCAKRQKFFLSFQAWETI